MDRNGTAAQLRRAPDRRRADQPGAAGRKRALGGSQGARENPGGRTLQRDASGRTEPGGESDVLPVRRQRRVPRLQHGRDRRARPARDRGRPSRRQRSADRDDTRSRRRRVDPARRAARHAPGLSDRIRLADVPHAAHERARQLASELSLPRHQRSLRLPRARAAAGQLPVCDDGLASGRGDRALSGR